MGRKGTHSNTQSGGTSLLKVVLTASYPHENVTEPGVHGDNAAAKEFIDKLLVIDPANRMTAAEALKHAWLASVPGGTEEQATSGESVVEPDDKGTQESAASTSGRRSPTTTASLKSIDSLERDLLCARVESERAASETPLMPRKRLREGKDDATPRASQEEERPRKQHNKK